MNDKKYYCRECGDAFEEVHGVILVGRDAELCLECLRKEYMRFLLQTQEEFTSVNEFLPAENVSVLVKTRNKYITSGSLNAKTWWVYDESKGEYHPRRADDPVEFWALIPGDPLR